MLLKILGLAFPIRNFPFSFPNALFIHDDSKPHDGNVVLHLIDATNLLPKAEIQLGPSEREVDTGLGNTAESFFPYVYSLR